MPFELHFGEADLLRCRFAVSPLWETQAAVRALKPPGRHGPHTWWRRQTRAAAEELDLAALWLLMPVRGHNPDFLGPPPLGPAASFDEEIAAVRAADPGAARTDLAKALADTPGAADSPLGRRLLADPARSVRELAGALEAAWHALVEPHWSRLRALLDADVAYHSRRLAEVGLGALLPELDRRLAWEAGTTLTASWHGRHTRRLDGRGLVLMPSVFSWPEVISGFDPPWQPTLVYPARGIADWWAAPADHTPEALARLLGRNRAAVLTALAQPATTSALAQRLGLAPSSVSAHLSTLRAAGLLHARRYGHQVLYERTPLGAALATGG
ncbi:DUF5937 family protein [Streptomyces longispororuber]|uniref:ArsR/SmtB family transcription factor n=1 Tax=Streptomyces longispororuber TaxID=68230 RepID=UPI0033E4A8C3